MSKAIEDLKHEHEAILAALQILERMIDTFQKNRALDPTDARSFVGFLKEFADKCHHGKEEGILFPALARAGIPEQGGPVGVMLSEHSDGRNLIGEMEESLAKADLSRFASSARRYQRLLRDHIEKENNILFPLAERTLPETEQRRIFASFEEHEELVIGKGRHEELHELLKALQKKYEAR